METPIPSSMKSACELDAGLVFQVDGKNYGDLKQSSLDPLVARTFLIIKHLKESFNRLDANWATAPQSGAVESADASTNTPAVLSKNTITYDQIKNTLLVMLLEYHMSMEIMKNLRGTMEGGVGGDVATRIPTVCKSIDDRMSIVLLNLGSKLKTILKDDEETLTIKTEDLKDDTKNIIKETDIRLLDTALRLYRVIQLFPKSIGETNYKEGGSETCTAFIESFIKDYYTSLGIDKKLFTIKDDSDKEDILKITDDDGILDFLNLKTEKSISVKNDGTTRTKPINVFATVDEKERETKFKKIETAITSKEIDNNSINQRINTIKNNFFKLQEVINYVAKKLTPAEPKVENKVEPSNRPKCSTNVNKLSIAYVDATQTFINFLYTIQKHIIDSETPSSSSGSEPGTSSSATPIDYETIIQEAKNATTYMAEGAAIYAGLYTPDNTGANQTEVPLNRALTANTFAQGINTYDESDAITALRHKANASSAAASIANILAQFYLDKINEIGTGEDKKAAKTEADAAATEAAKAADAADAAAKTETTLESLTKHAADAFAAAEAAFAAVNKLKGLFDSFPVCGNTDTDEEECEGEEELSQPPSGQPTPQPPSPPQTQAESDCVLQNYIALLYAISYIKDLQKSQKKNVQYIIATLRNYLATANKNKDTEPYKGIYGFLSKRQKELDEYTERFTPDREILGSVIKDNKKAIADGIKGVASGIGDVLQYLNFARFQQIEEAQKNLDAYRAFMKAMDKEQANQAGILQKLKELEEALVILKNQPPFSLTNDTTGEKYMKTIQDIIGEPSSSKINLSLITNRLVGGYVPHYVLHPDKYNCSAYKKFPGFHLYCSMLNELYRKNPQFKEEDLVRVLKDYYATVSKPLPVAALPAPVPAPAAPAPVPAPTPVPAPAPAPPPAIMPEIIKAINKIPLPDSDKVLVIALIQSRASVFEGMDARQEIKLPDVYNAVYKDISKSKESLPQDKQDELTRLQTYNHQETFKQLAQFNENLNTVRILLNYRTFFGEGKPETQTAGSNYATIANGIESKATFVPIQNLVAIETSGGNIGVGTSVGPFYKVFNSDSVKDYDINADLKKLESKDAQHLIYSAYGFSGSGKTYTLFGTPDKEGESVLGRILEGLKTIEEDKKYRIYDYYGEIDKGGCLEAVKTTPGDTRAKTLYYKNKDWNTDISQLRNDINAFNELRKTDLSGSTDGAVITSPKDKTYLTKPEERHIRATPNNDESSRSHLFVDIQVGNHRITLMDMAGAEDVDAIQNMYFENVTGYNVNNLNTKIDALAGFFNYIKKADIKKATIKNNPTDINITNITNHIIPVSKLSDDFNTLYKDFFTIKDGALLYTDNKQKIVPYTGLKEILVASPEEQVYTLIEESKDIQPETIIKPDAWNKLTEYNNDTGYTLFTANYNLYNYIKLIKPIYQLYTVINTLVNNNPFKNYYINPDLKTILNDILKITTPAISDEKYNKQAMQKIYTNYISKTPYGIVLDKIYTALEKYKEDILDKYLKNIDGSRYSQIYELVNTTVINTKTVEEWINHWNTTYIKNIHCPIRNQGNFIMGTLDAMKESVEALPKSVDKTLNKNTFPGSVLYKDENKSFNTRLMLFVNTRLDFDPNTDSPLRNAYKNALMFAVKINPLIPTGPLKNAANAYQAIGGRDVSVPMVRRMRTHSGGTERAEQFIEGLIHGGGAGRTAYGGARGSTFGGANRFVYGGAKSTAYGGAETLPAAPQAPAPQAAASPAPGAPANPQVIMEKAKKTYKDLNDIKKELIGVKNVMEGLQTKVNKFETFKKAVVDKETKEKKKIDTSSTGDINDAIGAYKYMKDEGKTLKGEFEKTVKEQLDKLESIQKRLTAVLEAEASTPAIRNDIETITKTFEQSIEGVKDTDEKPLTNTGLLNTLKGFSQTFATDFDEAFSFAKQIAEPVIEQQERDAKLRASNPMAAQEALQARQVFDVISGKWDKIKKKIEDTTKVIDALSQDKKTNKDIELFQKYVADIKQYLNTAQVAPNKPAAESAQKEFDEVYKLLNDLINKDEFNTAIAPPATAPPENPNTTKGGAGPLTPEQTTKVIDAGITAMDTILNKLLGIYKRQSTPGYAISGATGDNLFSKIFNEYMSSRTDENEVQARNRFIEQLEVNHLIPRKVLAITTMDRILFIFITLFIRTLCTAVIVSLIERGTITQMVWAITGYMIMYSLILIAFVLLVNLDMYRMRIIFNYVNFHANSGKIYMHLGLLVVIGILIYIVITRINFPVRSVPQKAISDNQKVRLIMRFQILTGILWGILALIVALENA